jgi:pimeloyl-ACP methyl ester carboxylesterase
MNLELLRVSAGRNEIAALAYEARRARGVTIVAGHGYSSSKHNLDALCAFLASHGFAVYSLDFPGHKLGASGGRLRDAQDLLDAVAAVVGLARERGAREVYTLGHSMGAVAALCAAAHDPAIAGAISIATGWGRPQALQALGARGVVDLRSGYVDGLTLPEIATAWEPIMEAALPRLAGRPVLYVAADRDAMVARAAVDALFERAPDPKTFAIIASDHTFAGENARSTILQWLGARHPRVLADASP